MDKPYTEYELEIRNTPLFSLNRETEFSAYYRESEKLIISIYNYVTTLNSIYLEYADMIVSTAKTCIENYDPDKGEFINYFNSSWSNTKKSIAYEQLSDAYAGQKFTQAEALAISKFKNVLKELEREEGTEYDAENLTPEMEKRVAYRMEIPVGKVKKYRWIVANLPIHDRICTEDGEISIIEYEQGKGNVIQINMDGNPEEIIQRESDMSEYYEKLELYFEQKQERQKNLISKLITSEIYQTVYGDERILEELQKYSFYDTNTMEECVKQGSGLSQRQIAEIMKRTEASVSRSWSDFKEGLILWMKTGADNV